MGAAHQGLSLFWTKQLVHAWTKQAMSSSFLDS
jgi:hypothetical protein